MAISTFFSGLSFVSSVSKMRKALIEYFKEEGILCEVKDGALLFEYDEVHYCVNFVDGEDYAECGIVYSLADEAYAALEQSEKTFIATKVNNEVDNHATLYVYNDSLKVVTTFYFTSKKMMMALFLKHFNELRDCISATIELAKECINEALSENEEADKPRQIGFCVQETETDEKEEMKVSAKRR